MPWTAPSLLTLDWDRREENRAICTSAETAGPPATLFAYPSWQAAFQADSSEHRQRPGLHAAE